MRRGDHVLAIGLAFGLSAYAAPARAQHAGAEALFREGRSLVRKGKIAEGCAKLQASERLESSVGTLLNLGDCRERLGQTASAWAAFRRAEALAGRVRGDERRRAEARRRALRLEPRLTNLLVEVRQPVAGLTIRRNRDLIERGAWNTPVPVDPGRYVIVAEAPAHVPWRTELTVVDRHRVVGVPALRPVSSPQTVAREQPRSRPATSPWSPAREIAVAVGVVGATALAGGTYYGLRSRTLAREADARCPQVACPDPEALRLNDHARSAASRANILLAGGGLAVATAAVMWVVGRPDREPMVAPVVSDGAVGATLVRRF
jgi:hypothetical protein